jgi:uncharacterized repeat protein (TIGR03943 family)
MKQTTDDVAGGLLILLGVAALRLILGDAFERFVRPGMRWPLIFTGVFFVLLGVATIARSWKSRTASHSGSGHDTAAPSEGPVDDDHHHHGGIGWLLVVPVLVLLLVAPTSLGAYAARRAVRTTSLPQSIDLGTPPAPAADGAIQMTLGEYSEWALYDRNESLQGKRVRLVGFVAADDDAPGGYYLTRFRIACCAADAAVIQIALHGELPPLADDTWITVYGTWKPTKLDPDGNEAFRAELTVESITPQNAQSDPYETAVG